MPAPISNPAQTPSSTPTTATNASTTTTTEMIMVIMAPTVEYHCDHKQLEAGRLETGVEQEQKGPEEQSTEREGNRGEKENKQELEDRKEDTGEVLWILDIHHYIFPISFQFYLQVENSMQHLSIFLLRVYLDFP
jgi:hypothetical protein